MIEPDEAMNFLGFVEARHQVWEARQEGLSQPWTTDPIVSTRKFTNVFRVLDYGSQFLLRELVDPPLSPRDQLMRFFLYRHTGRTETWEYLDLTLGGYPLVKDLDDVLEAWKEYRGVPFTRSLFTGAYLVFPQSHIKGTDKIESIVRLAQRLFTEGSPDDIVPDFMAATTQAARFSALRRNKGVADFMSQQILTDWGYTQEFREDDFVVAGPGARKGADILDPRSKAEDVIEWAVQAIRSMPIVPTIGDGRMPSYMDAQNCLCEFSKYVRYQGKPAPTTKYEPAHPGPQTIVLPRHW